MMVGLPYKISQRHLLALYFPFRNDGCCLTTRLATHFGHASYNAAVHLHLKYALFLAPYVESDNFATAAFVRAQVLRELIMPAQLTEEQESLLASAVEHARDRARGAWQISDDFSRASVDDAFDSGFAAAMDFALSDEFGRLISKLKLMLDEGGPLH